MAFLNVTPSGEVKLPAEILGILGLEKGGMLQVAQKKSGEITVRKADEDTIRDASIEALHEAQAAFAGVAEELDVHDEDDVQALVDEVRYSKKR